MVEVFLNNATKKIEGRYHQSKDTNAPVVLILHHHPQYGGSMDSRLYIVYMNLLSIITFLH